MKWWNAQSKRNRVVMVIVALFALAVATSSADEEPTTAEAPTTSAPAAARSATPTASPTASPEAAYSEECRSAFAEAAAVDPMRDTHEDMDPAFIACASLAEFAAASADHPDALDGVDPSLYAETRCEFSENAAVRASNICREVAASLAPTPTPEPTAFTFGGGVRTVGSDVPPGTYRTREAPSTCYWARLRGFGGTTDDIMANHLGSGYAVVTIAPEDEGFESQGCGLWSADLSAVKAPDAPFEEGTFIVGTDITPGRWRASGGSYCYWARLSGFGGETSTDVIANHLGEGSAVVEIQPTDAGFETTGCGEWERAE